MVTYLFYGINAVLFGVCVWVMFDSPFSPHEMSFNFPFYLLNGTPALTLYYLSALGVGYFLKRLGVTMFTRTSVHCAERITAISSSNGLPYSSAVSACG